MLDCWWVQQWGRMLGLQLELQLDQMWVQRLDQQWVLMWDLLLAMM
jgi:hypothetical protein